MGFSDTHYVLVAKIKSSKLRCGFVSNKKQELQGESLFGLSHIWVTRTLVRLIAIGEAQERRRLLPQEPSPDSSHAMVNVVVRLPDGRRLPARRFAGTDTVASLYLYADIARIELECEVLDEVDADHGGQEPNMKMHVSSGAFELYVARPARLLAEVSSALVLY